MRVSFAYTAIFDIAIDPMPFTWLTLKKTFSQNLSNGNSDQTRYTRFPIDNNELYCIVFIFVDAFHFYAKLKWKLAALVAIAIVGLILISIKMVVIHGLMRTLNPIC